MTVGEGDVNQYCTHPHSHNRRTCWTSCIQITCGRTVHSPCVRSFLLTHHILLRLCDENQWKVISTENTNRTICIQCTEFEPTVKVQISDIVTSSHNTQTRHNKHKGCISGLWVVSSHLLLIVVPSGVKQSTAQPLLALWQLLNV